MSDHLYLAHHGIKGMKWGVRRFQNPDGSLTEAGARRYKIGSDGKLQKLTVQEKRQRTLNEYVSGKDLSPLSKMSAQSQMQERHGAIRDEFTKTEEGSKLYKEWSDRIDEYENLSRMARTADVDGHRMLHDYFTKKASNFREEQVTKAAKKLAEAEGHYTVAKMLDQYGERGVERYMNDMWFAVPRQYGETVADWFVRDNKVYWDYSSR